MQMNKYLLSMLLGLSLLGNIQHSFASPAQSKSIKELIKLSDLEHALNTSLDEMQPTLDLEAENILLRVLGKDELTTT
jgi:hypothetical protein